MIDLDNPNRPPDRALLDTPGGFTWWYADLVDVTGDGLVLIWSFGLPFLPGYASSARSDQPERPRARPSVNIAVYRGGRPAFWLLQEYAPEDAWWAPGTEQVVLGRSSFVTHVDGHRRLSARLDCPLPGTAERLVGTVDIEGPALAISGHDGPHLWTPLTTGTGTADLRVGDRRITVSGRAYHDRNSSRVPLHALGIDHWLWGRVALPDRDRVWYLLWSDGMVALGMDLHEDGRVDGPFALDVVRGRPRHARYGLSVPRTLDLSRAGDPWLAVAHGPPVEDGPFYLRFPVRAKDGHGWGEVVHPGRVDLAWQRPLVRMRVHRAQGGNSPFLPLFTGPRDGRVRRFLVGAS